jgi:hypothetical protein
LREGKRQLEQHRWDEPDAVSRSREERLLVAGGRLDRDLSVERRANDAYEAYREQVSEISAGCEVRRRRWRSSSPAAG